MSIAETILEQLGGHRFIAMTGARNLLNCGNSLRFRIPGNITKHRINSVEIVLTPDDLYTMKFGKVTIRKNGDFEFKIISEHEDIYFDQLQEIFTEETGLYTHL